MAALMAAIAAACVLRFVHLEHRVVWLDEGISVLRAAGYTQVEFAGAFRDGREHAVREIRVYQGIGTTRAAAAVVHSLVLEDPQHPPVYYVLLNLWQRSTGGSVASQRALSVLIGIALIPAMYWLCIELFACRRTAAIGAALMAVSPFFFAYSHQLREYGLLALCALVAQSLLLRAQRSGAPLTWMLYAFSIAAGLYTDLFFVLIIAAHVLYLAVAPEPPRAKWSGIAAIAGAIVLYAPWIAVLLTHTQAADETNAWSGVAWPLKMLAAKWAFNVGATFFDLEYVNLRLGIALIPIFVATVCAIYYAIARTNRMQKAFIGTLLFSTIALFGLSDIVLHAHRSAITRYDTLSYLALLLCMTAMLGYLTGTRRTQAAGRAVTLALVAAGLASCIGASQSLVWWDNHQDDEMIPIADTINSAPSALVVAYGPSKMIDLLSFRLRDDVRIVFPRSGVHRVTSGQVFLAASQDDALRVMSRSAGVAFQPVYAASYGTAWEAFHRPLPRGDLVDADAQKLSLWRIRDVLPRV